MIAFFLSQLIVAATPESYAIVVGNNQSPSLERPQLQYADDDAVRTAEVLMAAVAPSEVELLTELDDDSARLFPNVVARALLPTRAEVKAAFGRMETWAQARHAAGAKTRGYFVFAGHGDIDRGEGFLELKDGRLTGAEMERMLKGSSADELHVVLDSCNSWFVLSPRKAGGRQFPTPAAATRALAERLPKVGVLLSTSAEAEVYEWSELQSGVFSYALRSGLIGGADANSDGDVSYEELAAFIELATNGIKNAALRPKIFARGPNGNVAAGFASLSVSGGRMLTAKTEGPLRLRFRDGAGIRWFDVHLDQGASVTLRLPREWPDGLVVQRSVASGWATFELPRGAAKLDLSAVVARQPEAANSRGTSQALADLFSVPFSEQSVSDWRKTEAATEQSKALGLSSATIDRVGFFLRTAANRDRSSRYVNVALSVSLLAGSLAVGLAASFQEAQNRALFAGLGIVLGLEGLVFAGLGLIRSPWETESEHFDARVRSGDGVGAVVSVDTFLQERLQHYEGARRANRVVGAVIAGLAVAYAVGFTVAFAQNAPALRALIWGSGATMAVMGVGLIASSFWLRAPEQDLFDAIREERSPTPSVSVGPSLVPGGAGLSLSGRF